MFGNDEEIQEATHVFLWQFQFVTSLQSSVHAPTIRIVTYRITSVLIDSRWVGRRHLERCILELMLSLQGTLRRSSSTIHRGSRVADITLGPL